MLADVLPPNGRIEPERNTPNWVNRCLAVKCISVIGLKSQNDLVNLENYLTGPKMFNLCGVVAKMTDCPLTSEL